MDKWKSTLENMEMIDKSFWHDRKVLITGHSGFKGSWLSFWLKNLGAKVYGISLAPNTNPSLFNQLNLIDTLDESHFIDIRNNLELDKIIFKLRPEVVFHLAAQPLVLEGYKNPLMTWETNLMGSLNLLNSLTNLRTKLSLVMITTDKVYKNKEWIYGYREQDELGGYDPYSASKAACEMAIDSWRLSYCEPKNNEETLLRIASARSGNVIGGGDWSKDRIIPDAIRALNKNTEIILRNPNSTRPWQHVLDPLSGYILLAEKLYKYSQENNNDLKNKFATSYNFGPSIESNKKVIELVEEISKYWSGLKVTNTIDNNFHEANRLNLQTDKSFHYLQWRPKWDFENSVKRTIEWYKKIQNSNITAREVCLFDIEEYMDT
jgi:CDP-glucose 4,6-dehydratase